MNETERATKQLCHTHRPPGARFFMTSGRALAVFWLLTVSIFAALFFRLVPSNFVEHVYAPTVLAAQRAVLGGIASLVPFSLAEVLVAAFGLLGLFAASELVWRLVRRADRSRRGRWRACKTFAWVSLAAAWLYLSGHGIALARPPLADRLALPLVAQDARATRLSELGLEVARTAREERIEWTRSSSNGDGTDVPASERHAIQQEARTALLAILGTVAPDCILPPGGIKACYPPRLLMRFGVSGVFSPFTFEAHADPGLHRLEMPFVAVHELAHVAGFAGEDEANFIAWLACSRTPNPLFRYSAALAAMRFLPQSSALRAEAGSEVAADRVAIANHWQQKRWKVTSKVQRIVWDAALKSQGVRSGIASYGEMVELMLRWRLAGRTTR
ncbi:MAG: DUF3810 family protein [Planctomycetes bacterium]|nr:DUF3810 family protein [Planctomycetota bacterium]MCB9917613.1 DUF3810 family protein [Planctomycetota bacterium]